LDLFSISKLSEFYPSKSCSSSYRCFTHPAQKDPGSFLGGGLKDEFNPDVYWQHRSETQLVR